MISYTDAHCHLDAENAPQGPQPIIDRARAAGVERLIAVGVGNKGAALADVQALAERDPKIWFSAGIHPHDAKEASDEEMALIRTALAHPRCVALGEVGLDYYYDNSPREEQRALFRRMIALAEETKKPLMLHIRNAHEEALAMLSEARPTVPGMVHCYTEGPEFAEAYLKLGFYLSIPGIVTFKTAAPLQEAVRIAPRDRIVIETDSPYLAPIPMRGKKNEPAYLVYTARKVAELWGTSEEDVAIATEANVTRLFGL